MKKLILMGQTGSGKTTLCQKLHEQELRYKKTQAVEQFADAIDTPGEYLENRRLYHALITTSADAKVVGLVTDPTSDNSYLPPAFAGAFGGKKVIGIITKTGEALAGQIERAKGELKQAGADPIFLVDTPGGRGIDELTEYLEEIK